MSQYRVTYLHRERELTKDVAASSEKEAAQVFKHTFGRGITPVSVALIDYPSPPKAAPARQAHRGPFRRQGTEQELRSIAAGLRDFRAQFAAKQKP